MGVSIGVSRSIFDRGKYADYTPPPPRNPNPNPYKYQVNRMQIAYGYLVLDITYPDATNYEGRKILLFDRGVRLIHLQAQGAIDPHFSERGIAPIARFEPTERGWQMALDMCMVPWLKDRYAEAQRGGRDVLDMD